MLNEQSESEVYRASQGIASNAWLFFLGGMALVGVAAVGFMLALRSHVGQMQLQLATTMPMLLAVGLFGTGDRLARAPREVVVSQQGLAIRFGKAVRELGWIEIAWVDVQTQAMGQRKLLAIYGVDGKVLVKLPENLERFDTLVELMKLRLAAHPPAQANAVQWRKSKHTGAALLAGATFALAGSIWMVWTSYDAR